MRLYYSPGACSLASHIVLREAKLPFTLVKVDLKAKKTDAGQDYRTINPKGYVPALQLDDGALLTENIAILPYLASLASPQLLPHEGMAKWHAIETLGFVSTELHKSFKPLFDPTSSDDAKAKAKEFIAQRLVLAEGILGERAFIVGSSFSAVDAYLFVILSWAEKQGVAIPPRLAKYFETLKTRPAVQDALAHER